MTPEQAEYARELADWAQPGTDGYDQGEWIYVPVLENEGEDYYNALGKAGLTPIEKMREGSCNTYACIAGKIAIDKAPAGTFVVDGEALRLPDGKVVKIFDFAREELGLNTAQARAVFFSGEQTAAGRLRYLADHPDATSAEILAAIGAGAA